MNFIEKIFPELAGQTWQVIAITLSIIVLCYVLLAVAEWKTFTKMGEKGWKAFIPVYNLYLLLKRCSKANYMWHLIAAGALCLLTDVLYMSKLLPDGSWQFWVCAAIQLISVIWIVVVEIKALHGVSKSFGHGAGFTVGLILLTFIFLLILGLGSSEYRPVNKEKKE